MADERIVRLKVVACKAAYHGRSSKNGAEFTIYEVEATKPDGSPINENLRSFSALPVGQEIEVKVSPYNSEKYGRSFTLFPKDSKSTNFAQAINELTQAQSQQGEIIAKLAARLTELEEFVRGIGKGGLPSSGTASVADQTLDAAFGAEAPF